MKGWFRERFPLDMTRLRAALEEDLPDHMRYWWFCLGGVPLLMFMVLVFTGVLLATYYVPEPAGAYESIRRIQQDIRYGWWVRGVHHWAAQFMVVTVILHTIRVFFTSAYRKPRELCWVAGALLLLCTLLMGFTGYALTWTQQAYWAMTVGTNLAEAVPLVGPYVAHFLRGGPTVGPQTLTRIYAIHTFILPSVIVLLMSIHIVIMRLHGIAEHAAEIAQEMVRGLSR